MFNIYIYIYMVYIYVYRGGSLPLPRSLLLPLPRLLLPLPRLLGTAEVRIDSDKFNDSL